MKRNRKRNKRMSVMASRSVYFFAVLFTGVVMAVLYVLASSRCTRMMKEIGEKEIVIRRLDNDLKRETVRWDEMKMPGKLEAALLRHGLNMKYPKSEQIVRMRPNGTPFPGQLSIALIEKRRGKVKVASAVSPRRGKVHVR